MNRGAGILVPAVLLAMLGGIALALWPVLARDTVALGTVLPRTTFPADVKTIDDAITLALEEHSFRAGRVRVCYADLEAGISFKPASRITTLPTAANGVPLADLYFLELPPVLPVEGQSRCARSHPLEAEQAAEWAKGLKFRSVYLVGADDFCGDSGGVISSSLQIALDPLHDCVCQFFLPALRIPGLSVAGADRIPAGKSVPVGVISRVARWKTDLVCLDLPGTAGKAVGELRKAGYKGMILVSSRSLDPQFFADAGEAARGVRSILSLYPPASAEFLRRSKGKPAHPLASVAYDLVRRTLQSWDQADIRSLRDAQAVPPIALPEEPPAVFVFRDGSFRRE